MDKKMIKNSLLVMYMLHLTGNITVKKMHLSAFALKAQGGRESEDTFDYSFKKVDDCPYAEELRENIDVLKKEELVAENQGRLSLTERGKSLLNRVENYKFPKRLFYFYAKLYEGFSENEMIEEVSQKYDVGVFKEGEVISMDEIYSYTSLREWRKKTAAEVSYTIKEVEEKRSPEKTIETLEEIDGFVKDA